MDAPTASIFIAIVGAAGVAFNTWLTSRSLISSQKNAKEIAETKTIALSTAAETRDIKISVDGNLKKLLQTMEQKGAAESKLQYTAGASDQRAAAEGVIITEIKLDNGSVK